VELVIFYWIRPSERVVCKEGLSCRTERIGLVLKIFIGILLPLPLLLVPVLAIVGSLLSGIGYGAFVPLMATFEAVGEGVTDKLAHCFMVCTCLLKFR